MPRRGVLAPWCADDREQVFQQSVVVPPASAVVRWLCDEDQAQKIVFNRRALAPLLPAATVPGDEARG